MKAVDNMRELQNIIEQSKSIVFFGGAGVSTESGIPDFRSVDGLYNLKYDFPPEQILSHTFFMENTEEFYRFYRDATPMDSSCNLVLHEKVGEVLGRIDI